MSAYLNHVWKMFGSSDLRPGCSSHHLKDFKSQYYYLGTRARVGSMFPHQRMKSRVSLICDYFTSKHKHNKGNKTDWVLSESTVHIRLCTVHLFWQWKGFRLQSYFIKQNKTSRKTWQSLLTSKRKKYPLKTKDIGKLLYHYNIVKENTGIAVK